MTDFNSRSEMRRLADQAPEKLIKRIEEQDRQIEELLRLNHDWQKASEKDLIKLNKVRDERDEARRQLADLTQGKKLDDGTYQPSRLEALESDREERDYFEARYCETKDKLAIAREALDWIGTVGPKTFWDCLHKARHAIAKIDEVSRD